MPTKIAEEMADVVVATRKARPTWGPKKLRAWLLHHHPELEVPASSTMGEVLRRRGLTMSRPRRVRATKAATQPFASVDGPNATWCVDFKGQFRTRDGVRCYPLTILDAHSRFLIRCEGVLDPDGREQQRAFDLFRRVYNEERPHEALAQKPPATAYAASARRYPCRLVRFVSAPWHHAMRVDKQGFLTWNKQRVFISTALGHEDVDLRYDGETEQWDVVFGPLSLGVLVETARGLRFQPSRGRVVDAREVEWSLDE